MKRAFVMLAAVVIAACGDAAGPEDDAKTPRPPGFTFHGETLEGHPDSVWLYLEAGAAVELALSSESVVSLRITDAGQEQLASTNASRDAIVLAGPVALSGPALVLVFRNEWDGGTAPSAYTLSTRGVDARPEDAQANHTLGPAVIRESLENRSDRDVFRIEVQPGEVIAARVRAVAPAAHQVTAALKGPGGTFFRLRAPNASGWATSYPDADAGWYDLEITGIRPGPLVAGGPESMYDVTFHAVDPAPESASSMLTTNDPETEILNGYIDIDTFSFDGHAGQRLNGEILTAGGSEAAVMVHVKFPGGRENTRVWYADFALPLDLDETGRYVVTISPGGDNPVEYTILLEPPGS